MRRFGMRLAWMCMLVAGACSESGLDRDCNINADCDDNNACTDDICLEDHTCSHQNNTTPCDDGLFCNGGDVCNGQGECIHHGDPCGGWDCDEQADVCESLSWYSIAAGGKHTCAISADGVVFCWGYDFVGQLGDGQATNGGSTSPVKVDVSSIVGESTFVHLTVGYEYTCGLTSDGMAYCWGSDEFEQLGDGGESMDSQVSVPVDVSSIVGDSTFSQLTAGYGHTCGLTTDGVVYCWGDGWFGQLGNGGGSVSSQIPVAVDVSLIAGESTFSQLTCGQSHTCGLTTDGVAYCWGSDWKGQLGDDGGVSVDSRSPAEVDVSLITGESIFVKLTAGNWHTCGITTEGATYCWGDDWAGQLGDGGESIDSQVPVAVDVSSIAGESTFSQLTAGNMHTCGITTIGVAYCWGADWNGQLGNGEQPIDSQSPMAVDVSSIVGESTFSQLTAGNWHTCGITTDGATYCWGDDWAGQLGDGGVSVGSQIPVAVDMSSIAGTKIFARLTAGDEHTCGLTADGVAYCWGDDGAGQLGDGGESVNSQMPVAVDVSSIVGESTFSQLAAGGSHTCGLATDGIAYCWGDDKEGQLGDGVGLVDSQTPVAVDVSVIPGGTSFVQLTVGEEHACGLTHDGVAYCWGDDDVGQLGNGGDIHLSQRPIAVDITSIDP